MATPPATSTSRMRAEMATAPGLSPCTQMLSARRCSAEPSADGQHEVEIPAIFNQLSPRQLDVARLVGKGQTNYQIACELGITENTVKLYVSQVLRLTHMHNRTQLALALSPGTSGSRLRVTAH